MTEVEQRHRGSFKQMETELIDKLDMLVNETSEDEECDEVRSIPNIQKYFVKLENYFRCSTI